MKHKLQFISFIINRKYLLFVTWFVVPAFFSLFVLRVLYVFHHFGFIDVPPESRHQLNTINMRFPIFSYTIGVIFSSLLFSKAFLKLKKNVIGYSAGAFLGILVYIVAVSFNGVILILICDAAMLLDLERFLASITFFTLTSFTGFCLQDCVIGHAWPSFPFGMVWGIFLVFILKMDYLNKANQH